MAFWKKKSEDPWDRDPNQPYSGTTTYYEKETGAFETKQENPTLLDEVREWKEEWDRDKAERKRKEAESLPPMVCPWCGKDMTDVYLVCGRDRPVLTEEKPGAFLGVIGMERVELINEGLFTTTKKCRQCKDCRKLVVDIPEPGIPGDPGAWWENEPGQRPDGGTYWDGNIPSPAEEETEKE